MDLSVQHPQQQQQQPPGQPQELQGRQGDAGRAISAAHDPANAENRMLFFAKVLRSATDDEVRELFSRFGRVHEVNLFRAFQGAPTTKGCGLVTMGSHEEAVAAIQGLDSKYTWEGMDSTMVVKWMDVAMQRRRREQHLAAVRQGLVPNFAVSSDWRMPPAMPGGFVLAGSFPGHSMGMAPMHGMGMAHAHGMGVASSSTGLLPQDTERPPIGCDPDAIKLFVGNLPKSCTEQQLLQLFESVGKVVELVIVRDKSTQQPKGSAFVWYATRAFAERAILQFNLRHCLPDPAGEQDRPLVVRKAKSRATAVHPAIGMLAGDPMAQQLADPLMGHMGLLPGQAPLALHYPGHPGAVALAPGIVAPGIDGMPMQAAPQLTMMNPMNPMAYKGAGAMSGAAPVLAGNMGDAYEYDAQRQRGGVASGDGDGSGGAYGANQGLDSLRQVAASVPVSQQQMGIVNQYLFSVQAMSGAQLSITPGAPGLFHLVVTGNVVQVDNARNLLGSLLNGSA